MWDFFNREKMQFKNIRIEDADANASSGNMQKKWL